MGKKIFESDIVIKGSVIKYGGTSSQFLKADGSTDSSVYMPTSPLFNIYLNFIDTTPFPYVAPIAFKVDSVTNPNAVIFSLTNNGVAYVLGNTILQYDNFLITVVSAGFLNLNCESIW